MIFSCHRSASRKARAGRTIASAHGWSEGACVSPPNLADMGSRSRAIGSAAVFVALLCAAMSVAVAEEAEGVGEGLELVATVPYVDGTHLVQATIKGREYLFAASQSTAVAKLRVIDITNPPKPRLVAEIDCGHFQGNLQVSADRKTLIVGMDGVAGGGLCSPMPGEGFATIDISDPADPRPVGFASIPGGSHSTAAHPSKPLVYNAPEGSPVPDRRPAPVLEVWSIANPAKPRMINTVALPGLHSPHDISFSKDGSMAGLANISTFHLVDSRAPNEPVVEYTGQCPGCQHTHEARFTPNNRTLVVNDESMSGSAYPCPGGALYFYDISGKPGTRGVELAGSYAPDDLAVNAAGTAGFCTGHVFDISANGKRLAASWHSGGIRYLDISKYSGHTLGTTWSSGPVAAKEIGSYATPNGDYFAAKLHKGPYIYAVDMTTGLQIFKITAG